MNVAFNPYREWLGLDEHIEAPNYYELLAVPLFDEDAARLLAAADRALVRVRGHRPGAQAAAWARLLDELAAAKRCLCDPQQKAAYDRSLRSGGNRGTERPRSTADRTPEIAAVNLSPDLFPPGMAPTTEPTTGRMQPNAPAGPQVVPTPPAAAATTSPSVPTERPADRGMRNVSARDHAPAVAPIHNLTPPDSGLAGSTRPKHPLAHAMPPGRPTAVGDATFAQGAEDTSDSDAVHTPVPPGPVNAHVAPPRREPVSLLPMAAIVTSVVVVITVIILVIALHDEKGGSPLVPTRPAPQPATDTQPPKIGPIQPSVTNIVPAPSGGSRPVSGSPSKPTPTAASGSAPPTVGPVGSVLTGAGATSAQPAADGPSTPNPPTMSSDTGAPLTAPPSDTVAENALSASGTDPSSTEPSTVKTGSNDAAADATVPMVSDSAAPAEPVAATTDELKQLGQTLGRARSALSQHEFVEVRRLLEQARKLARSDEHVALVERLSMLADLAEQFWSGVATATRQLQATQEIKVGSGDLIVVVVEIGPDWLIVRNQGRNTRYLIGEMPPGLALAIARQNMNEDDPQTQLVFGAGLATVKELKPVHLEEARRYWERAAAAGADAAPLQSALTDTYELGE